MDNLNKEAVQKEVVISIRGLYKSFGENHVLKGIDLDVYKGETVGVLGRSGSGKSVLIKIIAGMLKPDNGEVIVLGKEMDILNKKALMNLRLKIGFLFQGSALYDSMTVRENLEFPLTRNYRGLKRSEVNSEVEAVLDAVGLSQTAGQMPSELSGGQKKRIAIARTLILRPGIILYDEPTAGLDPITSMEINNLINEVNDKYNTTSIVITHDLTCARVTGNRIFMLHGGRFIKEGSYEEVFDTDDERIKGFLDYQSFSK